MSLENILKQVELADHVSVIAGGLQNPTTRTEADKKKNEVALKYLFETKQFKDQADFEASTLPQDRPAVIGTTFDRIPILSYENALTQFQKDGVSALQKGGKYIPSILKLASDEEAVRHASEFLSKKDKKFGSLVQLYIGYENNKGIIKALDDGKELGNEITNKLLESAGDARSEAEQKRLIASGNTDAYAAAAGAITKVVTISRAKVDKKILKEGVQAQLKDIEGKMKAINPNYEQIVAEGLGDYLVDLSKSSGVEKDGKTPISLRAPQILYQLERGYGPGTREFKVLYKK
ncbi:MAG: hypothetical protein Q7R87_03620 [Nanoarchaeota archaeon]|nr:hypothetical protein [Nanoarchaeota archaeon]